MAKSKRRSLVKKPPRLRRVAASVVGLQTPSKPAANPRVRKSGADLPTPSRWRVVTAYFQVSKGKCRLPRGDMQELRRRFPSYNLIPRLVQRIVKNYRNQEEEEPLAEDVDLSRKLREKCCGANLKLSVEISHKLIELNDRR